MIARLLVALAALIGSTGFTGINAGVGQCPPRGDFQGSMWQDAATTTGCSGSTCQVPGSEFLRWTRQAMAECEGCLVYVGDAEIDRGLPMLHEEPRIPFITSTVLGMHFATGTPRERRVLNWTKIMADVRARVPEGRRGPIFVADIRWDLANRWLLDQVAPNAINPAWVLRSDRTIQDFGAWVTGLTGTYSHCRLPVGAANTTEQYDDAQGGTGCNRTFGTGTGEWGVRIYDQLEALEAGLGDHMVAYVSGDSNPSILSVGALMNLKHTGYQDFVVSMCAALIAQGFDACDYPHKRQQLCNDDGSAPCTPVQYWPITGDGRGGADETMGLGLADDFDSLDEIEAIGAFSGPPEIPNGVAGCATAGGCAYLYRDYMQGYVETQRKNTTAGNATVVNVSPYLWAGCPKSADAWDSAYDDAACTNRENDADGAACEACESREVAQRATYVLVNLGDKNLRHASIGSGAGSGWSFEELKALILNPPGGGPAPIEVYPFNEYGSPNARGTPAKLCGDPDGISEPNPEAGIVDTHLLGAVPASADAEVTLAFLADGPAAMRAAGVQIHHFYRSVRELVADNIGTLMGLLGSPTVISVSLFDGTSAQPAPDTPACNAGGWTSPACWLDYADDIATFCALYDPYAVVLGTEVNTFHAAHPGFEDEFIGLTEAIEAAMDTACPNTIVGVGFGYDPSREALIASLTSDEMDFAPLNAYGADGTFEHGDPQDGIDKLDQALDFAENDLGLPLAVPETGWSSAESLGSSISAQTTWAVLAKQWFEAHEEVIFLTAFLGFECQPDFRPGQPCYQRALSLAGGGTPDPTVLRRVFDHVNELGLIGNDGVPKPAFEALFGPMTALDRVQCADGIDNDGDGAEDAAGYDPDSDGKPADAGCTDASDDDESGGVSPFASVEIVARCSAKTGSTIAAPAFCSFEAVVDHTDPEVDEFHHLDYAWSFNEGSGNWPDGRARNVDAFPVAAHVFETAGTHTVELTVRDAAGNVGTDSIDVVVVAEDSAWASADTRCVSTSGTFTGCPASAATVTSSDFDAQMQTAAGKRTLYRCGETFAASVSPNVSSAAANGSLVGGFGSCSGNPAIVTWALDSNLFDDPDLDGWRFRDLAIQASATPDADQSPAIFTNVTGNAQVSDALLLRVTVTGASVCPGFLRPFASDAADGYNDRIGIVDTSCTAADTPNPGGWPGSLPSHRYSAWLGYSFTNTTATPANAAGMRMMGQDTVVFGHGSFAIKTTGGGQPGEWSWRSCAGTNTGVGGCDRPDQKVVIQGNDIWDDGTGTSRTVHFANSHDLTDPASSGIKKSDWIFARNRIHYGSTATRASVRALAVDGVEGLTVANNVFDFRRSPAPSSGADVAVIQANQCAGGTVDCAADADWWVAGNTVVRDASGSSAITVASASTVSGAVYATSNLAYDAGQADGITFCSGTWDVCASGGGNVGLFQSAQCPFAGASGTCNLTAPSQSVSVLELDLRASGGGLSSVNDDGYVHAGGTESGSLIRDFTGSLRPAAPAVGAFED